MFCQPDHSGLLEAQGTKTIYPVTASTSLLILWPTKEVGATGELRDPRRYRRGWRRLAADSAGGSGASNAMPCFACPSGLEPWIVDVNLRRGVAQRGEVFE